MSKVNIPSTFTLLSIAKWYENNKDVLDDIEECMECYGSGEHECSCGDTHECAACDGTGKENSMSITKVYINRLNKDIDLLLHYLGSLIADQESSGQIQQAIETKKQEMIRAAYRWKPTKK